MSNPALTANCQASRCNGVLHGRRIGGIRCGSVSSGRLHCLAGRVTLPAQTLQQLAPAGSRRTALQVVAFKDEPVTLKGAKMTKMDSMCFRFVVPHHKTSFGQSLKLVGSLPGLGAWSLDRAPNMQWTQGHTWVLELSLPVQEFEFKVVVGQNKSAHWEAGPNRKVKCGMHTDMQLPEGVVTYVACPFEQTRATQMVLALPRKAVQDALSAHHAALELLEARAAGDGMEDALSRHTVHASLLQGMLRVQPDMAVASSSGEKLELQPISKQVGMNPRDPFNEAADSSLLFPVPSLCIPPAAAAICSIDLSIYAAPHSATATLVAPDTAGTPQNDNASALSHSPAAAGSLYGSTLDAKDVEYLNDAGDSLRQGGAILAANNVVSMGAKAGSGYIAQSVFDAEPEPAMAKAEGTTARFGISLAATEGEVVAAAEADVIPAAGAAAPGSLDEASHTVDSWLTVEVPFEGLTSASATEAGAASSPPAATLDANAAAIGGTLSATTATRSSTQLHGMSLGMQASQYGVDPAFAAQLQQQALAWEQVRPAPDMSGPILRMSTPAAEEEEPVPQLAPAAITMAAEAVSAAEAAAFMSSEASEPWALAGRTSATIMGSMEGTIISGDVSMPSSSSSMNISTPAIPSAVASTPAESAALPSAHLADTKAQSPEEVQEADASRTEVDLEAVGAQVGSFFMLLSLLTGGAGMAYVNTYGAPTEIQEQLQAGASLLAALAESVPAFGIALAAWGTSMASAAASLPAALPTL